MPLPKEVLDSVAEDIKKAKSTLAELKDVLTDMHLAGMDTTKEDTEYKTLESDIRKLEVFYGFQKAKSQSPTKSPSG